MEKRNTLLLTIIAVATLLVAVVGATFAYFASSIETNNNIPVGVNTSNKQAIFIASTNGEININVESYMMQQGDVDESGATSNVETIANDLTSSAVLNVTLQASDDGHESSCSYDIVYTWNENSGNNFADQSSVESTGTSSTYYKSKYYVRTGGDLQDFKELTVEIDNESGVGTASEPLTYSSNIVPETNIDNFKITDSSNKIVLTKKKETITSVGTSEGQKAYSSYLVTFRFYNLAGKQDTLKGKNFSGQISVDNVEC